MIRKRFDLNPVQNAALKRKAHSLGISEAELVRRALNATLSEKIPASAQKDTALKSLLENSLRLSKIHRPNEAYRFDREDAYSSEPRFTRWESKEILG